MAMERVSPFLNSKLQLQSSSFHIEGMWRVMPYPLISIYMKISAYYYNWLPTPIDEDTLFNYAILSTGKIPQIATKMKLKVFKFSQWKILNMHFSNESQRFQYLTIQCGRIATVRNDLSYVPLCTGNQPTVCTHRAIASAF